jgi:5-oxoprolinase (ATP-hydrolysing)
MTENPAQWKFAVDRGGTFTDIVGCDPSGVFHLFKLLSNSPAYDDASIEGIRTMLNIRSGEPLPENRIAAIRLGTTVATNALLERKGCRAALLITRGFADLLEIGNQDRPDIFSLCVQKPSPLYSVVQEVDERIDRSGKVIQGLNAEGLRDSVKKLKQAGAEAVSVVLMHSWVNPEHELQCEKVLKDLGIGSIFLSHRAVNLIKIVGRGQSTLVDTYLSTIIAHYVNGIRGSTGRIPVEFMQSNGNLMKPEGFRGKDALLSGPAGGVVAVSKIIEQEQLRGVIGFDMGGTSTDVSRFEGRFEKRYEQEIAGIALQTEMLDIHTVASGGGSLLGFDGQKMLAGPQSAGSYPGPACYGFGGPLTITDANLMTGRIVPRYFPETFGPDRCSPLNSDIVREKFRLITDEINTGMGEAFSPQARAAGFIRVANEKMAMAIREISVSRGFDVRDYTLVCFGGAGGQHACSIAALLDIERIIIHPLNSVLSAYGIGCAKPAFRAERSVMKPFTPENHRELKGLFRVMEEQKVFKKQQGTAWTTKRQLDLRPRGTEPFIPLEYLDFNHTLEAFQDQYRRLFGFIPDSGSLEIVNIRIEVQESAEFFPPFHETAGQTEHVPEPETYHDIFYEHGTVQAPVFLRASLPSYADIPGPAIILDSNTTVVVDPDFTAHRNGDGMIVITRLRPGKDRVTARTGKPDPVLLEVFNNIFTGAAAEMGITLMNTAHSVNMKERRDFSCAVFNAQGELVANAPHIPVHLGSMADTVQALIKDRKDPMQDGDIILTNDPYRGGSHLSDMTVVCPVFAENGDIIFFTAARGHHSDVGGSTPGSMPPSARHIDEEGVLINDFLLVRDGKFREEGLNKLLAGHTYPARNTPERVLDLKAQIAACHKGKKNLHAIIARYGLKTVSDYMEHIRKNAELLIKTALFRFLNGSGSFSSVFEDHLDDGTNITVRVSITGGDNPPDTLKAVIDFTGTGKQHLSDNLNAPLSVVRSAVMYVLMTLIQSDIPLNSGCLKPVDIIIPDGTILSPMYPAPVASGNVETSQRVVDVLLGAFGIAGASQGTMNNLLFEAEDEPPYYETIAGGAGATEECSGASGVQVHMTNTRITDPEVLEFRHPGIRLERFTLRKGSGGRGKFSGGDGVIREIRFLKPATVSIISERRKYPPYGIRGGQAGTTGENILKRADGKEKLLGHRVVLKVQKNESIIIKTPGGGGYGK